MFMHFALRGKANSDSNSERWWSGTDWEDCQVRVCYVSYSAVGNLQDFTHILKVRGSVHIFGDVLSQKAQVLSW